MVWFNVVYGFLCFKIFGVFFGFVILLWMVIVVGFVVGLDWIGMDGWMSIIDLGNGGGV